MAQPLTGREIYNATSAQKQDMQKLGRMTLAQHQNIEKEEQKHIERTAKQRLAALKSNDEEAYLKLLDQAKDTRITHLLKQTDGSLSQLAASVKAQQRKAAERNADVTQSPTPDTFSVDVEQKAVDETHLQNTTVHNFTWQGVTVTVKDRKTKKPKVILDGIDGTVKAGELVALMGPSGSGKSTLLNVLARRNVAAAQIEGSILVNGTNPSLTTFRRLSSYVEQDDALIGSLTVRETLNFAARLANLHGLTRTERMRRIDGLLDSFGLRGQKDMLIGTPIRSGVSGGQKRRVSVASQLITAPKLLFLDEPTSGLDSVASLEVISYIKNVAKRNNLLVIVSIHQPSTTTFRLFDKLLLLSAGKTYYFGAASRVGPFFDSLGFRMPHQMNPAEFVLELMNVDFATHQDRAQERLELMQRGWQTSTQAKYVATEIATVNQTMGEISLENGKSSRENFFAVVLALLHRSFIKSYRDVVVYGVRVAMYTGLAILMGTVWLRLGSDQSDIQPFINAIFFSAAFMSFMAVAYVPAFLEDHSVYKKEESNGLYGAGEFMMANFLIGLPYLFFISLLFSCIAYWLVAFDATASAFWYFIMWLTLDLWAAESLVVFVSAIIPNGIVSLAIVAFANGLWMSVGGFLVTPRILNVFYRYAFHYIDYQTYVFQGMMVNEFSNRIYDCGSDCMCMYQTELAPLCKINGQGVLDQYNYSTGMTGTWVGIMIGIIAGYRILAWLVLILRK